MNELRQGNFQRIGEFEKIIDDLLNNVIEHIKIYAERDENQKIEMLYQFLSDFFNYHLFEALDNKTIKEIKSDFDRDLNELIKKLRQENRDERTVSHGRKPIHTIFKRMFRNNRSLDRQAQRDGKREINLENEEESIRKNLKYLLTLLTKDRTSLSHPQVVQLKKKVRELLIHFAKVVLQEFESLFDAEVDVEIQEADLIQDISEVMKKVKRNQKVYQRLGAIRAKIQSHCKNDVYVAKRMLDRAKALKQNVDGRFVKAEKGATKIPLVTEFPSGMVVLNIKDKKLLVLNPNYLLGKHGTGTAQVGSKFNQLKTSNQLYSALVKEVTPAKLTGGRVELREVNTGVNVGTDSLISIEDVPKWGHLTAENVRGTLMNVVHTSKPKPSTSLLNVILVQFNPQYGMNADKDFFMKYNKAFSEFEGAYAILTMFPGKYAPPASDQAFWSKHVLLK